jgi:hypothetical protein
MELSISVVYVSAYITTTDQMMFKPQYKKNYSCQTQAILLAEWLMMAHSMSNTHNVPKIYTLMVVDR